MKKMIIGLVVTILGISGFAEEGTPEFAKNWLESLVGEGYVAQQVINSDWTENEMYFRQFGAAKFHAGVIGITDPATMLSFYTSSMDIANLDKEVVGRIVDDTTPRGGLELSEIVKLHSSFNALIRDLYTLSRFNAYKQAADLYGVPQVEIYRFLYANNRFSPRILANFLKGIESDVRKAMRDAGRGIITVDGVNPVEQEMQPIIAAVNAPLFAGLAEAVLAVSGVEIEIPAIDVAELEAIKAAVWYGDKIPTPVLLNAIRFLLGTDGFNAWVQQYNAQ